MIKKIILIGWLSIFVFACERTGVDVLPTTPSVPTSTDHIFYTWQGNDIVIDLVSLQNTQNVASLDIIQAPDYGTAAFGEGNLLSYTPFASVVEAEDKVVVEVKNKNNGSEKVTLFFKIKAENDDLPCKSSAQADKIAVETGKNISIDVFANDQLCEATIEKNSLKITAAPKQGKASIVNQKIEFITNPNVLKGTDRFIYEYFTINSKGERTKQTASVNIAINEKNAGGNNGCKLKLTDDLVVLPPAFPFDSILIKPLENDKLCDSPSIGVLSIIQSAKYGKAVVTKGKNFISYTPQKSTIAPPPNAPITDEVLYRFCQNGNCDTAVVRIKISGNNPNNGNGGNCMMKVVNDDLTISLKKPKYEMSSAGILYINIFENDVICGFIKDFKIKNPNPSDAKFSSDKNIGGWVKYSPPGGKFALGTVGFDYEITDAKDKVFSAKVTIKFVD
jgi:hypothetical protein